MRAARKELNQLRRSCHNLLEIIKKEQDLLCVQKRCQRLQRGLSPLLPQADPLKKRRKQQLGLMKRGQRDREDSIGKKRRGQLRQSLSQARLAHASHACQREQAYLWSG